MCIHVYRYTQCLPGERSQKRVYECEKIVLELRIYCICCRCCCTEISAQEKVVRPKLVVNGMRIVAEIRRGNHEAQEACLWCAAVEFEQLQFRMHCSLFEPRSLARTGFTVEKRRHHHNIGCVASHVEARIFSVVLVVVADDHPTCAVSRWTSPHHLSDHVVLDPVGSEKSTQQKRLVPVQLLVGYFCWQRH